jgi:hypothetical protein
VGERGEEELNVVALIRPPHQMEHILLESEATANGTRRRSGLKGGSESEDRDVLGKTASDEWSDVAKGRPEFIAPFVNQVSFVNANKGKVLTEQLRISNPFPLLFH